MLLDRDGRLETSDLPEVLCLARNHSQAAVAAILSEKKGLITVLDVLVFLRQSKQDLWARVAELRVSNRPEQAEQLARMIGEAFPPLTEDEHSEEAWIHDRHGSTQTPKHPMFD